MVTSQGTNAPATTGPATPLAAAAINSSSSTSTSTSIPTPTSHSVVKAPAGGVWLDSSPGLGASHIQGYEASSLSAMSSPFPQQSPQAGNAQQRSSPMPPFHQQSTLDTPRSSVPPSAASPAPTMASTASSSAMTPLQQLAPNPQNGAHGNGPPSRATPSASDERGGKRIKTEHDQAIPGEGGAYPMHMGNFMGYPGGNNMSMMMPGYGPPGSLPQNGMNPGAFTPNQGPMPPFAANASNSNGQFAFLPPHLQMPMQGYPGVPGGPQGNMGPPMWMPGANFPGLDQQQQQYQHSASGTPTPTAGSSTPVQGQAPGDATANPDKPPKQRKPRVKKEPGEKGKGKGKKKDAEAAAPAPEAAGAAAANGGSEEQASSGPSVPQLPSDSMVEESAPTNAEQAPAPPTGDGTPTPKEKGKRGPKTGKASKADKADKPKKPRKKKDKGGEGDAGTPGTRETPGASSAQAPAIPDEISVVQSLLAATAASSQPIEMPSEPTTSAATFPIEGTAAGTDSAEAAQINGAKSQQTGPAVEASGDNVDSLQDLLAGSGVDLRAEERAIQTNNTAPQPSASAAAATAAMRNAEATDGRPSPFYLELYALSYRIHRTASRSGLRVEPEVLMYLSNAARLRFRNLLEAMIAASRHRAWSSHLRPPPMYPRSNKPMYHEELLDDPQKLLGALTRVEKAEEQASRQRRMLRDEQSADAGAALGQAETDTAERGAGSGLDSGTQTPGLAGADTNRSKKTGVSATARNMSEDKRLKLANITAAQALGISSSSKAWMSATGSGGSGSSTPFGAARQNSGGASKLPKPRFAQQASEKSNGNASDANGHRDDVKGEDGAESSAVGPPSANNPGGWGDLTARRRHREEEERRRARLVNLDDALHALEMERSGGAGRGSGERALYMTRALGRPFVPPPSSESGPSAL